MIDRTIAPYFQAIDNFNLIHPNKIILDNGCPLFYFNSEELSLVKVEWIFNNLCFDPSNPLLNKAVNAMLYEGTTHLTAKQIAYRIDFYGADLQMEYEHDHSRVVLLSLNKHLQHILPVIKDILTDSIFPEKELQIYIHNEQQKLQVNLRKHVTMASRTFHKALYGPTLYGFFPAGDEYAQLRREDLLQHFQAMYQPNNCTLLVSGKVDPSTLSLVSKLFGTHWPTRAHTPNISQPDPLAADKKFHYIKRADSLQSALVLGTSMVNRTHPDFPALQVLSTVLGGYFGSRLMKNLREDKGYTYGISSVLRSLKHAGTFYIVSEVAAASCKACMEEIYKEIKRLQVALITSEELTLVRNFMLGSLLGSLENIFSHADRFKSIYLANLGYEFYDRYIATIKHITPEQLLSLGGTYLDFDNFYKVIVGIYED